MEEGVRSKKRKSIEPASPERTGTTQQPPARRADDADVHVVAPGTLPDNQPEMDTTDGAGLPGTNDVATGSVLQPQPPAAPTMQVGGQQTSTSTPPQQETEAQIRVR